MRAIRSIRLKWASPFELRAFVQDLTGRETGGVFAAYLDVEYDPTLVAVGGSIIHSATYGQGPSGNVAIPGLIDEVGSFDGLDALGPSEYLLFTVPMTGSAAGNVSFVADPADLSPAHDVLVYGTVEVVPGEDPTPVIPPDRVAYVGTTLQVGEVFVPVAVDDAYETVAGEELIVDTLDGVLANDTDPGGATLTAIRGRRAGQWCPSAEQ